MKTKNVMREIKTLRSQIQIMEGNLEKRPRHEVAEKLKMAVAALDTIAMHCYGGEDGLFWPAGSASIDIAINALGKIGHQWVQLSQDRQYLRQLQSEYDEEHTADHFKLDLDPDLKRGK